MDRLSHLRGEAGGSRDSTLDTTSPPSESFMTANESTSKYYSLSEVDSTFDISPIKDVSLASTTTDSEGTITNADELISNLSPIGKKNDILDSYKIGKQIEAANILSGGVDIFDDNDNSYDGDELVIDDNVDVDDKSNPELKQAESMQFKSDENIIESTLINEEDDIASKDTEVVLQIDGKNVDAIDIGNGLYLYRKEGQEELAAVQIIDDDQQQPSFKFLKVRENAEGNLEVYEEIEIEVPKEVPAKEGKTADKKISSHVPIKDINKVISDTASNKVAERKVRTPKKEPISTTSEVVSEVNKETSPDGKSEVNLNGKMMKFSESRKSPVIGSFKPMTYHSTPNKEGIPLTKTMVDQQLHPNRHSDNIKKTIEVHTDSCKQRPIDTSPKYKDDDSKMNDITSTEKDIDEINEKDISLDEIKEKHVDTNESNEKIIDVKETNEKQAAEVIPQLILDDDSDSFKVVQSSNISNKNALDNKCVPKNTDVPMEQDNVIDSTEKDLNTDKVILQEVLHIEVVDEIKEKTKSDVNVIDEKHVESVQTDMDNIEADSNEEQVTTKTLVQSNNEIQAKEGDIIKINNDEPLAMEIDGPELDGLDRSDKENKAMEDNTHGDKQTETKADTNIQDETQCNVVEEIIVIDDSVIDESTIEQNVSMKKDSKVKENISKEKESKIEEKISKEKESKIEKDFSKVKESKIEEHVLASDTKAETIGVNDQEEAKVEANIEIKITETKLKESVQNTKEKDVAVVENVLITSETKAALEPPKEKVDDTPAVAESGKNNPSKIPIPQSNKITNKPTKSESVVTVEPTKSNSKSEHPIVDIPKEKTPTPKEKVSKTKEIAPIKTLEAVPKKDVVQKDKNTSLDVKPAKLDENTDDSKNIPIEVIQSKDKPDVVSKKLNMIVTQGPDVTTTVKISKQNEVKPIELKTTLKKEPKHTIQEESHASVVPMEVDSTVEVKTQVSKDEVISETIVTIAEMKKPVTPDQSSTAIEIHESNVQKDEKKINILPEDNASTQVKTGDDAEVSKVPKEEPVPSVSFKQDVSSTSSTDNKSTQEGTSKVDANDNKEVASCSEPKPANNNNAAVPFGKWTATNRKEFLDKIKTRAPAAPTPSTSNQLKNSNDLNRRDVLKKIDSQRQSSNALSKTQEANKNNMKNETAFSSKTNFINKDNNTQESKIPLKTETVVEEQNVVVNKTTTTTTTVKHEDVTKIQNEPSQAAIAPNVTKKESSKRTEVNYQDLIDKTIEGMIHRTVPSQKVAQDEPSHNSTKDEIVAETVKFPQNYEPTDQATLDAIEMKMNELHGIPFIERPPHELPQVPLTELKTYSKSDKEKQPVPTKAPKLPNLLPFTNKNQQIIIKESIIEVDSEDEIIEHEPITGDIDLNVKSVAKKPTIKEKILNSVTEKSSTDATKKEAIITENDFDKFARRNSITYENRLTVNFDGKEPHNVIQTVVEKDPCPKSYSRNDIGRGDHKSKLPYKYQNVRQNPLPAKVQHSNKFGPATEDSSNRNHSKLQKAYQSALTAKRQMECPITIIEDKPVKVVFMDNMEFVPSQLNVQGQELSPSKKRIIESDNITVSTCDSLEDALDTEDGRSQDEVKIKTKHQRKQVFTPVDEPELELIEPKDLGLEVSPKKKRKSDEDKTVKYPMRKKYYLLGSNTVTDEKVINPVDVVKNPLKETINRNDNGVAHKNTVSAIDNLVKAAELLEHQSENFNISDSPNPDSQQSTPVKRGRGRPRKYPLPEEGAIDKNKAPSPQKKPRLIDAKAPQRDTTTDDDSDDEIIKENWTMGKINENIVCPICSKLFRTENVVFKHVKHCTGPSPSRSDSDKRSPRRMRQSQESDSKSRGSQSDDMDIDDDEPLIVRKEIPKKRNSKDSIAKSDDKDDVIVIEDTPVKEKPEVKEKVVDERKHHESRKPKPKAPPKNNDLVCEFCGKTFRQLSYLVSHKLQHKKDELKKTEKDPPINNKSVYSCEVCKKQFRKLHHLVQHRIIHNPSSIPAKSLRKSSSEQSENKVEKEPSTSKQSDDPSAGFRCEPCDKSFRKLHHLVEHRETHDGINRQKTTTAVPNNVEKPRAEPVHQCDVCKKTFNKAQLLIEHKEQHVETSSEKSDDKSVKSSLSTRDIIHECSHCYKVFPNEHSLNKHSSICQRKKRQSKQDKPTDKSEDVESVKEVGVCTNIDEKLDDLNSAQPVVVQIKDSIDKQIVDEKMDVPKEKPEAAKEIPPVVIHEIEKVKEIISEKVETKPIKPPVIPAKRDFTETQNTKTEAKSEVPEKIKKVEIKETPKIIHETPKKKIAPKEKSTASSSKRLKTTTAAVSVADEVKPSVESSDDDEVRYMLNPNFKVEDTTEEKVFMKVKAKKRSSLQIERPNSKDLVRRRTSLQHPPKIPRLKPKAIEVNTVTVKNIIKAPKLEPVPSTDSDDSETVKYSFPKTIPEKTTKAAQDRTPKDVERKTQKKSLVDKRKSLSGIAKRKSLGKAVVARHKPSPMKQIKRRTVEVEHRCDCGQLFSSAALLSRHTTLAHTPPRIRRRRSPPPEDKPVIKPAPRKSSVVEKPKQTPALRKSSARSDSSTSGTNTKPNKSEAKPTRKTLDKDMKTPADSKKPKPDKSEATSSVKPRRTGAHRGVPVPENMRKLMQKNNK